MGRTCSAKREKINTGIKNLVEQLKRGNLNVKE
jgi:hypothetical protein